MSANENSPRKSPDEHDDSSETPNSDLPSDSARDPLGRAVTTLVATYTDIAPAAPEANDILTKRAARPQNAQPTRLTSRWHRPALMAAFSVIVFAGGAVAITTLNGSGDDSLVTTESAGQDSEAAHSTGQDASGSASEPAVSEPSGVDETSNSEISNSESETTEADLGYLPGADLAGELPAAAPDTYWVTAGPEADLMQIESRTGKILVNLGGWGQDVDVDVSNGDPVQLLARVEVVPGGSIYVDDCCEPAYGNIFRFDSSLETDKTSELRELFWKNGLNPKVSPSGQLIMYGVGSSLQVANQDGTDLSSIGDPSNDASDRGFAPLAWIDEQTIAVRITRNGTEELAEEIGVYELRSDQLIERSTARRTVPDRFYRDGAIRGDGMLVVAGRRPTGDPLEPLGGGDLVAEVIDPASGELLTEFDLPDRVLEIDYDESGRFLIASGPDRVYWYGAGGSGVLAEGFISASWQ